MKFAAQCTECNASLRFNTYAERGDWVGKHRVRTAHTITVWKEE